MQLLNLFFFCSIFPLLYGNKFYEKWQTLKNACFILKSEYICDCSLFNHCFSLECCGHIVRTNTFFQMQESPHERMFFVISRDMGCSCFCTVWVHLLEFLRYTSIVNHGRVKLKIYLRMDWREGHNFRNVWWTLVYNFRYYKKYDFYFFVCIWKSS